MICDEKEIISKAKEIKSQVKTISNIIGEMSDALENVTQFGVQDKKLSERLLEVANNINTLKGNYYSVGCALQKELRMFSITVDDKDNFSFPREFESVLLKAIDSRLSL